MHRLFTSSPRSLSSSRKLPNVLTKSRNASTKPERQHRLPASYYRGGTSRAIIFSQASLPPSREVWAPIFRAVIGSPDPNGRQLDGLGGGISSLSKVCVVGRSGRPDADVDYTFAAIGVRDEEVGFESNCGNMTSAIGPWAVDNGLVETEEEESMVTVRIHNTNTGKIIHSTFPVVGGEAIADGQFAIDGVAGTGAKIELAFIDPAGSKTGKLFPTGNVTDLFDNVKATCIDVGNPCVFVQAADMGSEGTILPDEMDGNTTLLERLESIRQQASVAMGLSSTRSSTSGSIPKIALVSPSKSHKLLSSKTIDGKDIDLVVRALSVGQPHRAVPITVAMAIAAAANVEGSTVRNVVSSERADEDGITLGHSSGKILVGARFDERKRLVHATVFRTARRLMDGFVYWK